MEFVDLLGWIGNGVIVLAQWQVGNRRRSAFLVSAVGELICIAYAVFIHLWSLVFVCVLFAGIALRNYIKLKKIFK